MTQVNNFDYGLINNDLILQSLSDGVCVVNADRSIVFANRSAGKLLRREHAELIGKSYDIVFFQRDKTRFPAELAICPIQFALSDGAASHINSEVFIRADGQNLLVEYVCSPVIENGRTLGAVLTFQDISERRDIEAAVAEARDAAFEAARVKAAFLANMSHEIRTPLSGIVGTANLLFDTELNSQQRNYLRMLQKSVDTLMETVNDILDFSKIEAGKMTLETVEFGLRELIDEIVSLFRFSAERKKLKLEVTIEESVENEFLGDVNRLRQVLNNLLSNAVKFTETGGVNLHISASPEHVAPRLVLFEIADSGIGIDALRQNHLFRPFEQADLSTARRFGGTGLGLAICREIVEMMSGEIGFESEKGKGSKFWFTVSLAPGVGRRDFPQYSGQSKSVETDRDLRILVVDDDEVNREITGKLLEHLGYKPQFASNGAAAVKMAVASRFDLILMDLQMPEVDGFSAAGMIREAAPVPPPKIVALTAFSADTERAKCIQVGMDDYQCKPITKHDLTEIIRRLFPTLTPAPNLDLTEKFSQHSLAEIITPEILRSFLTIEARGEQNFVAEIFQIFCENADKQLSELSGEIETRDAASVRRRAHSLKGSSANVGLVKLTALLEELQSSASDDDWIETDRILGVIGEEFEFVKRKIQEG